MEIMKEKISGSPPSSTVTSVTDEMLDQIARLEELSMDDLIIRPQVRKVFDEKLLREIIGSIQQVGLLHPIRVIQVGTRFLIEDGERRYRAFGLIGRKTIPAIVVPGTVHDSAMVRNQLISSCHRADLNPIEVALGIATLMRLEECNATEVAVKLGMSNAKVSRLLALLTLPQAIQGEVMSGAIPSSAAYKLCQIEDKELQSSLAARMAAGEMTRDELERTIKVRAKPESTKARSSSKRAVADLGQGRTVTVTAESLSLDSYIEILSELLARARREKDSGIGIETFCKMVSEKSQAS